MTNFTPQSYEIGERLDKVLKGRFPQFSRNWIQKMMKQGLVVLNGKKADPDARLRNRDLVNFQMLPPPPVIEVPKPDPKIKFGVVYEDAEIAVIEKPSGLVAHPSDTVKWGTLVSGLLHRWPQTEGVGEDPQRPGIVHRLDRGTSGLMVVAKTQRAFEILKSQFQNREVEKKYLALLAGRTPKLKGEIDAPLARSKSDPTKRSVGGTRQAITLYEVLRRFDKYTFVQAMPKTGRTHQLRVHFAYIGHPIAGDTLYAQKRTKPPEGLHRIFLHACYIKFRLVSGNEVFFESPLPPELQLILDDLDKVKKPNK